MSAQAAEQIIPEDEDVREEHHDSAEEAEGLVASRVYEIPPINAMLERVVKETGKSYGSQFSDILRLCFTGNGLNLDEYFELRLYDDEKYTLEQKLEFVGLKKSREIWLKLYTDNTVWGVMVDKIAAGGLFKGLGFPASETLAVYSDTLSVPAVECMRSGDEIAAFLRANGYRAMFGKPISSNQSLGSIAIDRVDNDIIHAGDGSHIAVGDFARFVTSEFPEGYLIQSRVNPHVDIARICGNRVATVRLLTTCLDGDAQIMGAALKIPAGDSMADNYWRVGNIIADVDIETGVLGRAVSGYGLDQVEMPRHPDTNAQITGFGLPKWHEATELALEGQQVLGEVPLIGWDIAISNTGPLIIEANEMPDFKIMQYASGRGLLNERFKQFLAKFRDVSSARKATTRKSALKTLRKEDLRQIKGTMKRA